MKLPSFFVKKNKQILWTVFILYSLFTFTMIFFHEIWFDEAQAFLIAKTMSPAGIVGFMKYEGHSALWHFILFPFAKLGAGIIAMQLISWAFMVISAWILLFRSPFSTITKFVLLFSAGFIYLNVTVARGYSLAVLLLFYIALCYPKRNEKPILFGILLGLLANTHIMLSGLVGILGIYMFVDCLKLWKTSTRKQNITRIVGMGSALFLIFLLVHQVFSSITSNHTTSTKSYSFSSVMQRASNAVGSWISSLVAVGEDSLVHYIFYLLLTIVFILFIIFLVKELWPKKRRFIIMLAVNYLFSSIANCVFWYYNAHRSTILLLTFFIIIWISGIEVKKSRSILILTIITAITIPLGLRLVVTDIKYPFSVAEETASFISENLPKDAIFVISYDVMAPEVACYNPDIKIWDCISRKYVKICSHEDLTNNKDGNNFINYEYYIEKYFKPSDNVYILESSKENVIIPHFECIFISNKSHISPCFIDVDSTYKIYKYHFDNTKK